MRSRKAPSPDPKPEEASEAGEESVNDVNNAPRIPDKEDRAESQKEELPCIKTRGGIFDSQKVTNSLKDETYVEPKVVDLNSSRSRGWRKRANVAMSPHPKFRRAKLQLGQPSETTSTGPCQSINSRTPLTSCFSRSLDLPSQLRGRRPSSSTFDLTLSSPACRLWHFC